MLDAFVSAENFNMTGKWGVNKSSASKFFLLFSVDGTPFSHSFPVCHGCLSFCPPPPHTQCFIRGGEDIAARWSDHKLQ